MRWFWGLIIVVIGIVFLGINFGWWNSINISNIGDFWPLILILFGLGLIFKKWWWGFIPVIIIFAGLCLGLFYLIKTDTSGNWKVFHSQAQTTPFSADIPASVKNMRLEINTGAVNLKLSQGNKLIDGSLKSRSMTPELNVRVENETAIVTLNTPVNHSIFSGQNNLDINITDQIPVELVINTGASTINLDLSKIKLANLAIKAGASTISADFGEIINSAKVNFDAGASTIKLNFKKDTGVKIVNQSGLSTKKFQDFNQINNETYQSQNYDSALNKCEVNFKTGASTLEVKLSR